MKGLVFTEFMAMVEEKFGMDMVDDLIDETDPTSGGAYTAVGTYNHQELVDMVSVLSDKVNIPVPALINAFGHHLGVIFTQKFPDFFAEVNNTLDFLKKIDNHIHVEVRKLYPDAELPVFEFDDSNADEFKLIYKSERGFADLAQGLIEASATHYKEQFDIARNDQNEAGLHITEFILSKAS